MIWLRFVVSEGITSVVLGTLTTSSVNRSKRMRVCLMFARFRPVLELKLGACPQ